VGHPREEANAAKELVARLSFDRLLQLPDHQSRLLLLRDTLSKAVNHLARSMPPTCVSAALQHFDHKVLGVVLSCLEACASDITRTTEIEISFPLSRGGLGIPRLSEVSKIAYFASVHQVIQTWLLYIPQMDPMLATWCDDIGLDSAAVDHQPSTFSLRHELKSSLDHVNSVVTRSLTIKASSSPLIGNSKAKSHGRYATSHPFEDSYAISTLPRSLSGLLQFQKSKKLQAILMRHKASADVQDFKKDKLTTNEARAQYNSKSGFGSAGFLRAHPSDRGMRFRNNEFMIVLRMYLRVPILQKLGMQEGLPCQCHRIVKSGITRLTEQHLLNCNSAAVMTRRHDSVKNAVAEMIKQAKLVPLVEQSVISNPSAKLRFDVSAERYNASGQDLRVDITIVNPCTRARESTSALQQGHAAAVQREKKITKYRQHCSNHEDFYAFAFETYGLMDSSIPHLIQVLSERVGNLPPESATWTAYTFKSYWVQRLSCCLWRENARSIETVVNNTKAVYQDCMRLQDRDSYEVPVYPAPPNPGRLLIASNATTSRRSHQVVSGQPSAASHAAASLITIAADQEDDSDLVPVVLIPTSLDTAPATDKVDGDPPATAAAPASTSLQ